jgi:ActR/RegA family two-component response regulator
MTFSAANGPPSQQEKAPTSSSILLVQIDRSVLSALQGALERNGFRVVAKSKIIEALKCVVAEKFGALICDLHLPTAGDGFTLINAMRHFHPDAITMTLSNYPALKESISAFLPQADEVLLTPMPIDDIVTLLKNRLRDPKHRISNVRESVTTILERHSLSTIREWRTRANQSQELTHLRLSDDARTGHLSTLLKELVQRLRAPHLVEGKAKVSMAALAHGRMRSQQGYTAAMIVEESRILQVCIFNTLRTNLNAVDLALVLTDVMTIADEVDSQLKQTMASFSDQLVHEKRPRSVIAAS